MVLYCVASELYFVFGDHLVQALSLLCTLSFDKINLLK